MEAQHLETTEQTSNLVLPVDREHGGIRVVVGLLFLLGLPVSYILINLLIPSNGINVVAFIGSIAVTYGITQISENYLKQHWRSGRKLVVNDDSVKVIKDDKVETAIDTQQQVNVLTWRFEINKRTRIPKGWFMIACALEQDGEYLPAYTFVSPEDFESLEMAGYFTKLMSKKDLKSKKNDRDMRLAGEQRRLHNAESQRWMFGAELAKDDFDTYFHHLQQQFPKWMPSA